MESAISGRDKELINANCVYLLISQRFLRSLLPRGVPRGKADIVETFATGVKPVVRSRIFDGPPKDVPPKEEHD